MDRQTYGETELFLKILSIYRYDPCQLFVSQTLSETQTDRQDKCIIDSCEDNNLLGSNGNLIS